MKNQILLLGSFMLFSVLAFGQYNFYYGNLHAHTAFSDGNKDSTTTGVNNAGNSYAYAKNSYHFDFLGISEHNHYSYLRNPGMLLPRYAAGLAQADTASVEGSFIAMFGMEWGTISQGGHVVTYGSPGLIGWETISGSANYDTYCAKGDFTSYWNIIATQQKSFCTLAHPQTGDYNDLFGNGVFSKKADSVITGTAIRSGGAFSTTTDYTDAPANLYENEFFKTLARGYHVGPTIDHDNHYTTFGRTGPGRTVVLASSLNRDSLSDAFRQRRFYASDDWNAEVTFTINGYAMGSIDSTFYDPHIEVSVTDRDASDPVASIKIYYGVPGSGSLPVVLTSSSNTSGLSYIYPTAAGSSYYYFAKITQSDGDVIWTSPIWLYRQVGVLGIENINLFAAISGTSIHLSWENPGLPGLREIIISRLTGNNVFEPLELFSPLMPDGSIRLNYNYADQQPFTGNNFYRLQMVFQDGRVLYSNVAVATLTNVNEWVLYPNPVQDLLHIEFKATENAAAVAKVFSLEGRLVLSKNIRLQSGQKNDINIVVNALAAGPYYFVLQVSNKRLIDSRFIKK
ncbi:MAG: T9SS type A sorting domain-containing protein [Ferruginibacter sp.]